MHQLENMRPKELSPSPTNSGSLREEHPPTKRRRMSSRTNERSTTTAWTPPPVASQGRIATRSSSKKMLVTPKFWGKKELLKKKNPEHSGGTLTRSARKAMADLSTASSSKRSNKSADQSLVVKACRKLGKSPKNAIAATTESSSVAKTIDSTKTVQDLLAGKYTPVDESLAKHRASITPKVRLSLHGQATPFSPITPKAISSMFPSLNDSSMDNYWHPGKNIDAMLGSETLHTPRSEVRTVSSNATSTFPTDVSLKGNLIPTPSKQTPSPTQMLSSDFSGVTPTHFEPVAVKDFDAKGVEFPVEFIHQYMDCWNNTCDDNLDMLCTRQAAV